MGENSHAENHRNAARGILGTALNTRIERLGGYGGSSQGIYLQLKSGFARIALSFGWCYPQGAREASFG